VPETAVHEDGEAMGAKNKIGPTEEPLMTAPAGNAIGAE
jgi:hypothetical protein